MSAFHHLYRSSFGCDRQERALSATPSLEPSTAESQQATPIPNCRKSCLLYVGENSYNVPVALSFPPMVCLLKPQGVTSYRPRQPRLEEVPTHSSWGRVPSSRQDFP